MHIKFIRDYRGVNTNEQFFTAGTVVDHPNGAAIVAEGAAEVYTVEARKGQVEAKGSEHFVVGERSTVSVSKPTVKRGKS